MGSINRNWFATPAIVSAIRQAAEVLEQEQTGKHSELVQALNDTADSLEQYAMAPEPMLDLEFEDHEPHPAEAAGSDHERRLEIEGHGQWLYEQGQISYEELHKELDTFDDQNFSDIMRGMGWP